MAIASAPLIGDSTRQERKAYVDARHPCIADCDQCGFCAAFHGKDPSLVFADYIEGRAEYRDVAMRHR